MKKFLGLIVAIMVLMLVGCSEDTSIVGVERMSEEGYQYQIGVDSLTDFSVEVFYNNGDSEVISLSEDMLVDETQLQHTGLVEVRFWYDSYLFDISITIYETDIDLMLLTIYEVGVKANLIYIPYVEWISSFDGPLGTEIQDAVIDENGHLILTYSDTSEVDMGRIIQGEDPAPESYLVTFMNPLGFIIDVQMVEEGMSATDFIPEMPDGYIFTGWDKDITGIENNTMIKALYTKEQYSVVFDTTGYDILVSNLPSVEHGSMLPLENATLIGYDFLGWYTGNSPSDQKIYQGHIVTSDMVLYPRFERQTVTVRYHSNGGTSIPIEEFYWGDMIGNVPASSLDGMVFENWYTDSTFSSNFDPSMELTTDIDLYAKWLNLDYEVLGGISKTIIITGYTGNHNSVEIPSHINDVPVVEIGASAFQGKDFSYLILPDTIETIGDYAFKDCVNLGGLTLGDNIIDIGVGLFDGALSVESIVFEMEFEILPEYTFRNTPSLRNVTLPDNVRRIDTGAFFKSGITSLSIPSNVEVIGVEAFKESNIQETTFPESLLSIERNAFEGTRIISLHLPESLIEIENESFYGCKDLTSVYIGIGLQMIGDSVFVDTPNLTSITVHPESPYFAAIENVLFNDSIESLLHYPEGKVDTSYIAPSTLRGVMYRAIVNNKYLVTLTLPEQTYISEGNFLGLESLEAFALSPSSEPASLIVHEGVLYDWTNTRLLNYPMGKREKTYTLQTSTEYIEISAFQDATYLKQVVLNEGLLHIKSHAFDNADGIVTIDLPSTVEYIGSYAFSNMNLLNSITLNEGLAALYDGFLDGSPLVTDLTIPSTLQILTSYAIRELSHVNITLAAGNPYFVDDSYGAIYNATYTNLYHYPSDANTSLYTVDDRVTSIYCDFHNNSSLRMLFLRNSIYTFDSKVAPSFDRLVVTGGIFTILLFTDDVVEQFIEYDVQVYAFHLTLPEYKQTYPMMEHLFKVA